MSVVALLDADKGSGSVNKLIESGQVIRLPAETFEQAEQSYNQVMTGRVKCDLVVLDTLSTLLTNSIQAEMLEAVGAGGGKSIWQLRKALRTVNPWSVVNFNMVWLITAIRRLPMPSIITAHEGERSDPMAEENDPLRDTKTGEVKRHLPKLTPVVLQNLMGVSDLVLRMYRAPGNFTDTNGKTIWPAKTPVLELESAAETYTGIRLDRDVTANLVPFIADPSLQKLYQTIGSLPHGITVYGFPKSGKTTFSCTLP